MPARFACSLLLLGAFSLALPAFGQVPASVPNSTPAANSFAMRARRRWERHEAKVRHRIDKQRIKAVKRQQRHRERKPLRPRRRSGRGNFERP